MKYSLTGFVLLIVMVLGFAPGAVARTDAHRQKDSLRRVVASTEGAERNKARKELSCIYRVELYNEGMLDSLFVLYDQMDEIGRAHV